jgi:hypothetical protein
MTTLRAQAAIAAIDHAHLRHERRGLEKDRDDWEALAGDLAATYLEDYYEECKPAPELVRCEAWKECADETCRWKEPHKPNYGCTLEHVCSGRGSCRCIPVQDE